MWALHIIAEFPLRMVTVVAHFDCHRAEWLTAECIPNDGANFMGALWQGLHPSQQRREQIVNQLIDVSVIYRLLSTTLPVVYYDRSLYLQWDIFQ
jgi:hypothetical protein